MATEKVTYIIEGQDRLSPVIGKANKSVNTLGASMASLAPLLGAAVIVGGISKIISVSAKFEKSMSNVKALSGATGDTFVDLQNKAKELGKTTEFSASQAADAMGFLAMAGFDTNQIMGALPATLSLASAGGLDLARTADIASNILSGFGLEATQMNQVSDVLAKTFSSTNVDLNMLGETFKQVAPVASSLGFQFNETSAAIGILGNAGIQGSLAGTSLKNTMVKLATPTGKMNKVFSKLGIETRNSSGQLNTLTNIIGQLEKSGASGEQVMEAFGKIAGPGMLALLKVGSSGLSSFTEDLNNAGGTAEQIAKVKLDNLSGKLTILMSTLEGVAISIGDVLLPVLTNIVGFITRNIDVFGVLAGIIATVVIATTAWSLAQSLLNIIMALNPVSLVVIAIIALVAIITLAWRESEIFRGVIKGLWEGIKVIGLNIWSMLIEPFMALADIWQGLVDVFSGKGIDKLLDGLVRLGRSLLSNVMQPIIQILKGFDQIAGTSFAESLISATGVADVTAGAGNAIAKGFKDELAKETGKGEAKKISKGTKITTQAIGGSGGAGSGAIRGQLGADVSSVQGTKMTNIKIQINSLVETLEITAANLPESAEQMKETVTRALLTAVNDAQIIHG